MCTAVRSLGSLVRLESKRVRWVNIWVKKDSSLDWQGSSGVNLGSRMVMLGSRMERLGYNLASLANKMDLLDCNLGWLENMMDSLVNRKDL